MEYVTFATVFNTFLAGTLGWTFAQMFLVRRRLATLEKTALREAE